VTTLVSEIAGVSEMEAPALALVGVHKSWPGSTHALQGIDIEVHRGELLTLVGPSGCGKSTVLRIVAGLEDATEGDVLRPLDPPGCVFQQASLMPWRSVVRNVELFLELDGVPTRDRIEPVDRAIELVGLDGFRDHLPHQLSGGMQMRAALARALVTHPEVLLFDEPFAAVDELLRERLQEELSRLFAVQRFAGLFITHSVSEAVFLSTRVAVMTARPGRISTVVDVPFSHPRSPELRFDPEFVALTRRVSTALRDGAGDLNEMSS